MQSTDSTWRKLRSVWLAGLAVAVLSVGVAAAVEAYWMATRTSVSDVSTLVYSNIRIGEDVDAVFRFLDREQMRHGPIVPAEPYDTPREHGYAGFRVVVASIPNATRSWISPTTIYIYFIIDDNNRVEDILLDEVHSAL